MKSKTINDIDLNVAICFPNSSRNGTTNLREDTFKSFGRGVTWITGADEKQNQLQNL
jgi:hypothetical protein